MPKRPPMEIEFVASPRADAEEKHKALLALLARGVLVQLSSQRGSDSPRNEQHRAGQRT